jgi:hypothetical protein
VGLAGIGVGVDRNRFDAEVAAGPENTTGNLTPVGD